MEGCGDGFSLQFASGTEYEFSVEHRRTDENCFPFTQPQEAVNDQNSRDFLTMPGLSSLFRQEDNLREIWKFLPMLRF